MNSNLMVTLLDGAPFTAKPVLKIPWNKDVSCLRWSTEFGRAASCLNHGWFSRWYLQNN